MTQLDRDGDGKISLSDFAQCAEMLGLVPAEAAADDAAGSDSDEESAPRKPRRESLAMKAAKLFDQLDHDKSGSIDETELDIVLERLGLDDPEIRSKQVSRLSTSSFFFLFFLFLGHRLTLFCHFFPFFPPWR